MSLQCVWPGFLTHCLLVANANIYTSGELLLTKDLIAKGFRLDGIYRKGMVCSVNTKSRLIYKINSA